MRVLVVTASKHGSTAEVAEAVGKGLRNHGADAQVARPEDGTDAFGCDALVLGSAIHARHRLEPSTAFVRRVTDELQNKRFWRLSPGPVGKPLTPADGRAVLPALLATVSAQGHRVFCGATTTQSLGLAERVIVRMLRLPAGDCREWSAIKTWTRPIADGLGNASSE